MSSHEITNTHYTDCTAKSTVSQRNHMALDMTNDGKDGTSQTSPPPAALASRCPKAAASKSGLECASTFCGSRAGTNGAVGARRRWKRTCGASVPKTKMLLVSSFEGWCVVRGASLRVGGARVAVKLGGLKVVLTRVIKVFVTSQLLREGLRVS